MKLPSLPSNNLTDKYKESILRRLFMEDCPKIPRDNNLINLFNSNSQEKRKTNKPN